MCCCIVDWWFQPKDDPSWLQGGPLSFELVYNLWKPPMAKEIFTRFYHKPYWISIFIHQLSGDRTIFFGSMAWNHQRVSQDEAWASCLAKHLTTLEKQHYITFITLHYITLHYITLHCIALHYITLHYITLHYTTLHTYTHTYIHPSIHPSMHACMQTDRQTDMQTCRHACMQTCMQTYIHTYRQTYIQPYIQTHTHTAIHTYIHTYIQ